MNIPSLSPTPRSVKIKWDIMVAADSALDFLCNLKKRKRNLTFIFYIFKMKVCAYCFCKTNKRNKVWPNLLYGGSLRMRCAYLNETSKVSVLRLRNLRSFCTGFAVFLCVGLFKVSGSGPLEARPSLCPASLGALRFVWPWWGCLYPSQKSIFFALYSEQAFGFCVGMIFPWNLFASVLFLLAIHCLSSIISARTFHLKHLEEASLHLSRSTAEILSMSFIIPMFLIHTNLPGLHCHERN